MQNYAPGSNISLTFQLSNEAGEMLVPTALRWRVLDENEVEIQEWELVTLPTSDAVIVTIPASINSLPTGAVRALRVAELEITTDAGVFAFTQEALLQATSALQVGHNTFATYHQLVLASQDYSGMTIGPWERFESRDERERAMIQAHQAIMQLPLFVKPVANASVQHDHPAFYAPRAVALRDIPEEQFLTMVPADMRRALLHAQLLETCATLEADPVVLARRNGLMSMTVGESSQFFGQSRPLDVPTLSAPAFGLLKRWMNYTVRLGRGS